MSSSHPRGSDEPLRLRPRRVGICKNYSLGNYLKPVLTFGHDSQSRIVITGQSVSANADRFLTVTFFKDFQKKR